MAEQSGKNEDLEAYYFSSVAYLGTGLVGQGPTCWSLTMLT